MAAVNKYHVSPKAERTHDGIVFASKAEMRRYLELQMLERAGEISDLELQPEYVLMPPYKTKTGEKIRGIKYRADFRYLSCKTNRIIVEDVKGVQTKEYRIKKALLLWRYPNINFVEIRRDK